MLGIVGVWPSKHGEIIKSELSNGRRKKLLPSVVEFTYDWLRFEGYLGNVGLTAITISMVQYRMNAQMKTGILPSRIT